MATSAPAILSPTTESLNKATPEALKAFHDKYYAPNNAILAISGDLTVAKATELAKKYFGDVEEPSRRSACVRLCDWAGSRKDVSGRPSRIGAEQYPCGRAVVAPLGS